MPEQYKPVPVSSAKAIAEEFDKSIVVIASYDPIHGLLHTTTYGKEPQDKLWAANGGEIVTEALGGVLAESTNFEDYRINVINALLGELRKILQFKVLNPRDSARLQALIYWVETYVGKE